ncbi:MAG: ImmA/IrrE family metallo-endopeptidase [Liquorilactobacillus hordei]|uniref:ImmA/IrrE family metallo-endopeptidase n=1 Tax=Liquorilactobacillus hordei TaxID=468911 RepID=UPI0039EAC906
MSKKIDTNNMNININSVRYKISRIKKLWDEGEPCWGVTLFKENKIKLNNDLSAQKMEQVLVHELIHATLHEAGLDNYSNDEELINPFGNALYSLIMENQTLFRIMMDHYRQYAGEVATVS